MDTRSAGRCDMRFMHSLKVKRFKRRIDHVAAVAAAQSRELAHVATGVTPVMATRGFHGGSWCAHHYAL
jgi:hypothetical protein